MTAAMLLTGRWPERRRRAEELSGRWPFAAEVLGFYRALLDAQEHIYDEARERRVEVAGLAAFAAEHGIGRVLDATTAHGPEALAAAVVECFHDSLPEALVERWLHDGALSPAERFLARAAAGPALEAIDRAALQAAFGEPADDRHCPACGGPPQLGYFATDPDELVTAHKYLECSRCAAAWAFTRMMCASCGETETSKLGIYNEVGALEGERTGLVVKKPGESAPPGVRFPHLRIDTCSTCKTYLLNVDLTRDGRAVPAVDELAALPLDIYAKELGLHKIAPNLMGF